MADGIEPQPGILDIALYKGGASHLDGISNVLKLSSNENPLGASDAAKEAVVRASHDLHRYPPTDHSALRHAIAEVWGVDPDRVFCGVGSGEVLKLLAEAYAGPGDDVVFTEHGFSMYPIYAHASGANPVVVRENERVVDVDAILAACTDKTKLVFIANPANPTGTMIGHAEVARLADGLPPQALLVLDGAYAEYVDGFDAGKALVESRDNVVMSRTFSKIYGLGGLRVGWGYGPQAVIDVLNRIRGPFNLSSAALAGAEAAVRDTAHTEKCRIENARWRDWLANALAELGVPSDTSTANFILARFADAAEAQACDEHLRKAGIIVRQVAGYGLPQCLRITVGDESACRRVAHAVAQFKGAGK
ncbi:MAG: histidinol-phosphate transaminase [Yoonia sp.]|jgi:histidinol-phosphate aminotransferase|uniref:histidinol-phosphate transaminase n=1 Tax=Yoonia sp. TaxID=2212373 RepID=UPI00273FDCD9|nr:histidinol-phosphate transaminase [Yoonia sp.]MDP5084092.1 histidinol-phosphate transaminase [Yoonia sp.]MDP5362827.1 histidinol-phosphate transaminase [Paracoccaceae bacterium]